VWLAAPHPIMLRLQLTWQDPAAESASTSSGSYPPPLYQLNTVVDDKWTQDPTRHSGTRTSSTSSRGRILSSSSVSTLHSQKPSHSWFSPLFTLSQLVPVIYTLHTC
jgi:hypothetical protein